MFYTYLMLLICALIFVQAHARPCTRMSWHIHLGGILFELVARMFWGSESLLMQIAQYSVLFLELFLQCLDSRLYDPSHPTQHVFVQMAIFIPRATVQCRTTMY